ncbi:tRNA (adenosine(37)-N6)-dimethylallyltransferase MiaA [Aestuariibius sp. 2305UL40-4]|uniref:tRNA (adenosine(37)-N6)-dimethylallyltransferase MiaA n=1 Tax=Aestuariibius violaceus TaxID=3234132 RepID=UPI00345EB90E
MEIRDIPPEKPVLIAGPTASGKSDLALRIAELQGGTIVNADALQVYDGWRILTARPSPEDEARAPHALYGHVPHDQPYSAGQWLRDVTPHLTATRPIIVGGTGLNFAALTEGLAEIPETPPKIRAEGDERTLQTLLEELDPKTKSRIDTLNRARVQRAWEVLRATGRPLADWQDDTPPPLLPLDRTTPILLDADRDWLAHRIARRFDLMLDAGALDEARAMAPTWKPKHPSSKAIGAAELIAHLHGDLSLDAAKEAAIIQTRQYAKRQRTWFRARMRGWSHIPLP